VETQVLCEVDHISSLSPIGLHENCFFNPGPNSFLTRIAAPASQAFRAQQMLFIQSCQTLKNSRSDENLEIKRRTKALLGHLEHNSEDDALSLRRRRSANGDWPEDLEEWTKKTTMATLSDFK
jgi:hypothetical protein